MGVMKWGLAGIVAAVVAGALAFGVFGIASTAEAQTPPGGGDRRANREAILAQKLGVTVETLRNAQKATRDQLIDQAVAAGRITAQEAARLKSGQPGAQGMARGMGRGFGMGFGRTDILGTAAGSLGMTKEQLQTELKTKTLGQIAQEHGRTADAFKNTLSLQIKADLQKEVAAGRITQQQADRMSSGLDRMLTGILNRKAGDGMRPPGRPDRN